MKTRTDPVNKHTVFVKYILCAVLSRSVVSNSLRPHGLQNARPPYPSLSPRVCSNSCPLNQWCHPTISSSVAPSPPALNIHQHQAPFQWLSSSHQVAQSIGASAELVVFLEFLCLVYDLTNVGNLTSGSSAFSKSSLYIWNSSVHVLLKPSLKDFEHYLASKCWL